MVAHAKEVAEKRGLPPSERAFEVYRLIEVAGLSTRAVAQQVGLSQTRVVQLRESVEQWIGRQASASEGRTKEERLRAAEYKAGLRLDHLYALALEAFRQSQGPEATTEESLRGESVVRTRFSHGDTRYLAMAMRIAAQQSRIPTVSVHDEALADEEPAAETPVEVASPPEGDCSLAAESRERLVDGQEQAADASDDAAEPSAETPAERVVVSETTDAEFCPVHPGAAAAECVPTQTRPLSRKERKRRARMLARRGR
jgi:hypothetical protein